VRGAKEEAEEVGAFPLSQTNAGMQVEWHGEQSHKEPCAPSWTIWVHTSWVQPDPMGAKSQPPACGRQEHYFPLAGLYTGL
jgi:hypothetical protein